MRDPKLSSPIAPPAVSTRPASSRGSGGARPRFAIGWCNLFCAVVAIVVSGCAPEEFRKITPSVVDSGLETLTSPTNQERLRALASLPDLQLAASNSAKGVVDGYLGAFNDPGKLRRLDDLTRAFSDSAASAFTNEIETRIGPAIRHQSALLSREVAHALSDIDGKGNLEAVTSTIVSNLVRSMARGMEQDMAPALRRSLETQIGPALGELIQHDATPALAEGARAVSRQAWLGLNDALNGELGATFKAADESIWNHLDRTLERGRTTAESWFHFVAGVTIVLAVLLGVAALLWRAQARAVIRQEKALRLLTSGVRSVGRTGSVEDLLRHIKAQGKADPLEGYACLSEFLARHQDLKLPGHHGT